MRDELIAVIPARGGSKRLPRKNILPLAGKPMIVYTVEAVQQSGLFDSVYVATDDQEIAEVARSAGAEVPLLLPDELVGDTVASLDACVYLVDELERTSHSYDVLFCLQPTSPLRTGEDILACYKRLDGRADHVVSVTRIDPHYFHWAMREREGAWQMYFGREYAKDRLLLPAVYRPNGAVKISRLPALRQDRHFLFSERLGVCEMPEERSIHVATMFDVWCAEAVLSHRGQG